MIGRRSDGWDNVKSNSIGAVPNVLLASAPGK